MAEQTSFKQDINKGLIALLFIIILLLLTGLIAVAIFMNERVRQYELQIAGLNQEIVLQKDEKNIIRNIWQNQASSNDKLIVAQDNVISAIENYISEINNSFRFVNGQAQVISTANEKTLKNRLDSLNIEIKNLEDVSDESVDQKNKNKDTIDNLYLKSGEVQPNSAR